MGVSFSINLSPQERQPPDYLLAAPREGGCRLLSERVGFQSFLRAEDG